MSQTRQSADDQRLAAERELFERLHDADASDAERSGVRDELIETHMPLVHHLARRYADRGEPLEDVTQVATIGLIQAIDKFDPERGSAFSTYAVPTILGAIRRHFRDATWSVKVPRRVQELRGKIDAAHDALPDSSDGQWCPTTPKKAINKRFHFANAVGVSGSSG